MIFNFAMSNFEISLVRFIIRRSGFQDFTLRLAWLVKKNTKLDTLNSAGVWQKKGGDTKVRSGGLAESGRHETETNGTC